jgi:hypothetical protein
MKFGTAYLALACALASNTHDEVYAFSPSLTSRPTTLLSRSIRTTKSSSSSFLNSPSSSPSLVLLSMSESTSASGADDEIARLKAMAQKLRSEAAGLEANQAEERASVAKLAFEKFDKNQDGEISLAELKAGLEKSMKMELSNERVQKLMNEFDVSGDGSLQLDEMVSVDQFRNKLEAYAREEKSLAREAVGEAKKQEEMARIAEARLEILNDKDPTTKDKLISVIPYLFPLLDSLQFGRFLIMENADNPLVGLLGLLFTAYRSIPFSGFIAFLALNTLSSNPGLNKLIRFNMQQAIFLDIALFFPGLLTALIAGLGSVAGFTIPDAANQASSTAIFGVLLLTVLYTSISSLLGITPDAIPIISKAVEDRMPTTDMFDDEGKFVPREAREGKDEDKKDDDDKKKN